MTAREKQVLKKVLPLYDNMKRVKEFIKNNPDKMDWIVCFDIELVEHGLTSRMPEDFFIFTFEQIKEHLNNG